MSDPTVPLWRYIPLADYSPPPWSAGETVRRGFRAIWRSLRRDRTADDPAINPATLAHLPGALLEGVACQQPTSALTEAIGTALGPWAAAQPGAGPARVLVSATHCATRAALETWARSNDWKILGSPTVAQILDGGEEWLAEVSVPGDQGCVLPRLEKCFLRHADGLDLVRRLLGWLSDRRGGSIVGCNSWAWEFLRVALGANAMFPEPLTLAPFDADMLRRWFRELLASCPGSRAEFRNVRTGQLVLAASGGPGPDGARSEVGRHDDSLAHLAAGSRGIAAIAWSIWRHSLHLSDSDGGLGTAQGTGQGPAPTIWVKPWADLNLPEPPAQIEQAHRFICHALLLHGGLTEPQIDLILPANHAGLRQVLGVLASRGVIEASAGVWQVAHCAYPAVRSALVNEEFFAGVL